MTSSTRTRARTAALDAACAGAVELARAAAVEEAGEGPAGDGLVGEHLGAQADGDRLVTHLFACLSPAYRGWRWAVTVAGASRSKVVTVDEVVLLPGEDSVRPPEWVPWSERLRPGDLGVGDLLPTDPDDPRLEPGYADVLDEIDTAVLWELGLGRPRVLSRYGRNDAAERWYEGDRGPTAPIAQAAPAPCATCGFLLPLAGSMRGMFGVCTNEYAPDDARVVSYDHGCGAHSEVAVDASQVPVSPSLEVAEYEVVRIGAAAHSPGSVEDEAPAEDLGHS